MDADRYALICFFGAPHGKPHVAHGMIKLVDLSDTDSDQHGSLPLRQDFTVA